MPTEILSEYARPFDENNLNWTSTPEYNRLFLHCQQNYANDMLRARGHVFLNEVYDQLGMRRTREGVLVGWLLNEKDPQEIVFSVVKQGGKLMIDFNVDGLIYDKI